MMQKRMEIENNEKSRPHKEMELTVHWCYKINNYCIKNGDGLHTLLMHVVMALVNELFLNGFLAMRIFYPQEHVVHNYGSW